MTGAARGFSSAWMLAALLLTGCARQPDERTGVVFWHFWPKPVIQPILDQFEADHPDLRVESQQLTWQSGFEKIVLAFASGRVPDLCELGSTWVARFASEGVLTALDVPPDSLRQSVLLSEPGVYRDRVYALPWLVGTRALFFNRALFRRAGLDSGRPPETWRELLDAARRIDALGPEIHGFGTNAGERHVLYKKFMPFAWGNGGRILDDGGTRAVFDSDENLEALEFFLALAKASLIEKQAVLDQVFKEGRIGMLLSGSWNLKSIPEDAPSLEFGVALVPRPDKPSGEHVSFGGAEMLVIPAASDQPDAALELARFLAEPDQAWRIADEVRSVWPAARRAEERLSGLGPEAAVFVAQMQTARTPPADPRWVEIEAAIDTHLERALYGRAAPAAALGDAQRDIERILGS